MNYFSPSSDAAVRSSARSMGSTDELRLRAEKDPLLSRRGAKCASAADNFFSAASAGLIAVLVLFILFLSSSSLLAVQPGTIIDNTATAAYTVGGTGVASSSNLVRITTATTRTPSVLEFLQYAPAVPAAVPTMVSSTDYSTSGAGTGPFVPLPGPVQFGSNAPINLSVPVPLVPGTLYHSGEPLFIQLTDLDQNLDYAVIETALVTIKVIATGDTEVVRLYETGPNTGVFTGVIQTGLGPAAVGNGILSVEADSRIDGTYVDVADGTDSRIISALVDPYGKVFNSVTGLPVNSAAVTLINTATGLPATVLGDDGVSTFPNPVVTGATVADSGGRTYVFTPGGYRFPFIQPGRYRLDIAPPSNYRAPSVVPTATIQGLPNGPFALVDPGSRGQEFIVNPGPAIHIDIPVDPTGSGLWLTKIAGKTTAAVGDLIPYVLTVENTNAAVLSPGVTIRDRLPLGFRYRKGSTRLNAIPFADPVVSPDGSGLVFSIHDLAPGARATVSYVAEIGAGAHPGKAVNTAVATDVISAVSNLVSAEVLVTEDLFRSTSTIVGRVAIDGCGDPDRSAGVGLAQARIFLEDGTYVVTDQQGMFHFAAVKPGTHVVQLDTTTVPQHYELLLCDENTRVAGNPFSQFADLQGGTLWRVDFHLAVKPKEQGELGLGLRSAMVSVPATTTDSVSTEGKSVVAYAAPIFAGAVPVRNMRMTVMLPEGALLTPGSGRLNTLPVADPEITGNVLTFRLGDAPAGWEGTLRFDVAVPTLGPTGSMATRALLTADTPEAKNARTPVVENTLRREVLEELRTVPDVVLHPRFPTLSAELTRADLKELKRVVGSLQRTVVEHITVTGHTDAQEIRWRAKQQFADNYVLSRTRAEAVANELAKALNLRPDQITIIGKGPDEPIDTNATEKGRAQNRRVELEIKNRAVVLFAAVMTEHDASGMKAVATIGQRPGVVWPPEKGTTAVQDSKSMPAYNAAWLETAEPGTAWLWPPDNDHPAIANTKIAIKHDPGMTIRLLQNGAAVDALYFDGTVKKSDNTVAVSIWSGIHLVDGHNRFELIVLDPSGAEAGRVERSMHYSGSPQKAVLEPGRSRLIADGRNPAIVAVRLLDRDGHPARRGALGEFSIDFPYLPRQRAVELQQAPVIAQASQRFQYEVGEDGVALIELEATTRTGEAVIRIPLAKGEQEIRVWLKPEVRDWILVGLAEGTVGYDTVRGHMETLLGGDGLTEEGRLAFYTKGMIKGEWLITAAYDSKKSGDGKRDLYQTIDPNKYYTLYGDAGDQRYDAASAKNIYVKLERDQFYALFGDYNTGLTVTELSRYSRTFTGFKSEMKSEDFEYNLFLADTDQAFVKDELPGDGTSGLYRLSRRNIVTNSETITIETRDRFKSEVIVSQQQLTRFLDYSIDYEAGTVFFRSPVFSRDNNFNTNFIVASYESRDPSNTSYTYGGRAAMKFREQATLGNEQPDQRGDAQSRDVPKSQDRMLEVGVSYVHEGRVGGEGNLEGVDATLQLGPATKVHVEAATTKTEQTSITTEGSAYLAEVQHHTDQMDGKAYVREQAAGFGLGQQNGSETGTRKTGADLIYRIDQPWSVGGSVFRQENLATNATRDLAEFWGRYTGMKYEMTAGLRQAEDALASGETHQSDQFYTSMRYQLTERITARVQHDQSVGGSNDNVDFPTRTTVGLDYRLNQTATFFADQELTEGKQVDTATTRIGLRASPWTGGQMSSTMQQMETGNGLRLFSTLGLKQTWQLTKAWSIDGGVDRTATLRNTGTYTVNANVPPASGSTEDFTAVSLGAGYRQEKWSWSGRAEHRVSDSEEKVSFTTGAVGEVRRGLGLAAGLQTYRSVATGGVENFNGDIRIGFAYRPFETRIIMLERFDFLRADQQGAALSYENWRLVNNFVMNLRADSRTQVSIQYGAKYVQEAIEKDDYRGYTDLTGIEGRYDITKSWDVGLRVSMLHSWGLDQKSYGSQASVGYTAAKNLWVSIGYNFEGFKDRDFSRSEFTSQGLFVKLRMKFDQLSAAEAVKWFAGL
jgi:uncharacterized repeat protein (TIGR01451 family)